ncbi:MAG: cardiolipin synthase [Bacteroidaceae bacterium]|nr:cardiolipin synthase [Bacteroidaceae bacterium]
MSFSIGVILGWIYSFLAIILIVNVVLKNRDSVKTLAWVMVLLFLPVLGMLLYFFFGRDKRKERLIGRRFMSQINQRNLSANVSRYIPDLPQEYSSLHTFLRNTASAYALPADSIDVIADTKKYAELFMSELEKAEKHIHMLFYIFEDDEFGRAVREILMRKARQGVEVRFMYDSVGSWGVKRDFFDDMRSAGVYVESFLKVRFPLFSKKVNYRNHRKLVIIDGTTGFIGGCNVADRYITGGQWGYWRDTMLMVRGMAVQGLQFAFLVDWYFANHSLVSGKEYFPHQSKGNAGWVQVVTSNPVGEVRTLMGGIVKLLSSARNYVYLHTPYFLPNGSFMLALKSAALSGADVRLMIPERCDNKVVGYAARSYLGDLLKVGVKVYFYRKGFIHSKTIVCDDYLSSVGSVNLDYRSFYYNFEVSAFVYDRAVALELKNCFLEDIKHCRQITLHEYRNRSIFKRFVESCARLLSPLM